jgi:hypothetical protein
MLKETTLDKKRLKIMEHILDLFIQRKKRQDFSLTIFPNEQNKTWLVCLGIGSSGFKNDYELATYPGLRRLFSKLTDEKGFCKSDFSDIETSLPKSITGRSDLQHIKKYD